MKSISTKSQIKIKTDEVLSVLRERGILMCHDYELPSATSIIADEKIKGSWWPHKKGSLIFHTLGEVLNSNELLAPKLVNGKVTLLHKDLFSDFFTIVLTESDWQLESIKNDCRDLYKQITKKGELRSDQINWNGKRKLGDVVRDLEKKLLTYSLEIHTETGAHAKVIMNWKTFIKKNKLIYQNKNLEDAIYQLTNFANALGEKVKLPWE